jgi:hypothetical protein
MNPLNMIDGIHKFGTLQIIIKQCVINMLLMLINVEIMFMLNLLSEKVECIIEEIIAGKFTII